MSYTVKNGTATPIILNSFEGATYSIGAGEELAVESARAALTLEDFGASLSNEDREAAINEESGRAAKGDGNFGASTTDDFGREAGSDGEDGVETRVEGNEGAALGQGILVDGDVAHENPDAVVNDGDEKPADEKPAEPVVDSTVDKTVKAPAARK